MAKTKIKEDLKREALTKLNQQFGEIRSMVVPEFTTNLNIKILLETMANFFVDNFNDRIDQEIDLCKAHAERAQLQETKELFNCDIQTLKDLKIS